MVKFKIKSSEHGAHKGAADMVLMVTFTDNGEMMNESVVIDGRGSFEDMAHALGRLVGEVARVSFDSNLFLDLVNHSAAESLQGGNDLREVERCQVEEIERAEN